MKIYIAEDEPLAAAKTRLLLEKIGEGGDISTFDNGVSALAAIMREKPDILFLDIQMPGMTGMEVMERIKDVEVIVTSAFDQYALDSFRFQVTDYLLKPYSLERLQTAVSKAKESIRLKALDRQVHSANLSVRTNGKNEIIPLADITYVESVKDYIRIVTADGQSRMVLCTLRNLEDQLDKAAFVRVHRSYIVNVNYVVGTSAQELTLKDGTRVAVGKTYRDIVARIHGKPKLG